jgi:cellulose synthase/poly-beta-1,6-N-acetylglucosamine synthase-like glycosyltransferase
MNILILFALFFSFVPIFTYSIYSLAILFTKDASPLEPKMWPNITVVVPTYNEEAVIDKRIQNLSEINYGTDKIHVIVVDDKSSDSTLEIARNAFSKYGVSGEIINKKERTGTNSSVNTGIQKATTDIIVTTDADVVFEKDALLWTIGRLLSDDRIGAVCGELEPVIHEKSVSTGSEKAYRTVYGKICTWESNIMSTYCFNGPLIVLKKKAFSPIPETYGASDASMALSIIRNGYRCIYEKNAVFYEYITEDLAQQKRQKTRRSSRLQEATVANLGLLSPKYGMFGMVVFPLRISMFLIVPIFLILSLIAWLYFLYQISIFYCVMFLLLLVLLLFSGNVYPNLFSSFIWHQIYLVLSMRYMFRGMHIWKAIDRKEV